MPENEMSEWYQKEQLHFAADKGDLDRVKELIASGYDVNSFDDGLSLTPLHYAAKAENLEVMKYLLAVGADVNAHDEERIGETPLGEVAANCSYEVAKILTDAGANPIIPGWMQITALDRSKDRKKEEGVRVYELLLSVAKSKYHYKA